MFFFIFFSCVDSQRTNGSENSNSMQPAPDGGAAGRSVASSYSEGDDQKKLVVLKKAVIALTKQKQELELTNDALTAKLAQLGGALSEAHETENQLRLENEHLRDALKASQQGKGTGAAVATTLKGLFTSHAAHSPAVATPRGAAAQQRSTSPSTGAAGDINDAQEQLMHVNESMHMQLFEMKAAHAAAMKSAKEVEASLRSEVSKLNDANRLHAEGRSEQERELELLTAEVDGLKASLLFVHTFLWLEPAETLPPVAPTVRVVENIHKAEVPPAITHSAARRVSSLIQAVDRVTSAVGGIVAACKMLWEERGGTHKTTTQEVKRLRNLLAALANKPPALLGPLKTLAEMCNKEVSDHSHFTHVQIACMQPLQEWLSTLLPCIHLCVEASVPLSGRNAKYEVAANVLRHLGDEEPLHVSSLVSSVLRDVAVDAVSRGLRHHIAERECVLGTLQVLIARRQNRNLYPHALTLPSSAPSSCLLFLDTLQHAELLRNQAGDRPTASLGQCLNAWSALVVDGRVKRCIETLRSDVDGLAAIWSHPSQPPRAVNCLSSNSKFIDVAATSGDLRYMTALIEHADTSCLTYFTQCQHAIGELCVRNQQLDRSAAINAELRQMLDEKDEELKSTREAYELQLRVLSDTLTTADGAHE